MENVKLATEVLIRITIFLCLLIPAYTFAELEGSRIMPDSAYAGSNAEGNTLVCKVVSGDQKNREFIISKLEKHSVTVTRNNTNASSHYEKNRENKSIHTVEIVAETGAVETIIVDKTTGKFSRVATGNRRGLYTLESIGACR